MTKYFVSYAHPKGFGSIIVEASLCTPQDISDLTDEISRDECSPVALISFQALPDSPPDDKLRERLAAEQHAIWSHWMRYLFSVCRLNEDGSVTIPVDKAERWQRQMSTDYSALTEREKESDRHQSDKILVILQEKRRKANP